MSNEVERILREASGSSYFKRSIEAQMQNAHDVASAAQRFRSVAGHAMADAKVDRTAWYDSPEETLVDRCLHEAEVCMAMATTALCDYMKRTRGSVEPNDEGFA